MKTLKCYVGKSVFGAIFIVLFVVVALDVISGMVDQLEDIEGNFTFFEVIIYVLLSIPASIYDFIPLSALVGCLIGLGLLAGTSELVVMRAAGVSILQVIWSVMRPVIAYITVGVLLGEYVTPLSEQYRESRRAIKLGYESSLQGQRGVWHREGNEYMHFSAVLPNGRLFGITRFKMDEQGRLVESTYVQSAIYQGDHWIEEDGVVTHMQDGKVEKSRFDTRIWEPELSPLLLDVIVLGADELPMNRLYSYANYHEKQGSDDSEYRLSFWQKALQPLATASLVMIAISFIFGPLRQVTMGFRIFIGVIVGIVFQTSQDLLGPSSLIFGFSPMFAVLLPIAVCFGIGVLLLRRTA